MTSIKKGWGWEGMRGEGMRGERMVREAVGAVNLVKQSLV